MQKYRKAIINLIIIALLIGIPTGIFATDESVTIGEDLHFTEQLSDSVPYVDNFAPGDNVNHVMTIKNESSKQVGLYFVDAKEIVNNMNLDKIIFSIYINNSLYKTGNNIDLKEQLIYVLEPGEEITEVVNIALDKSAGNYYQGKEFEIDWTIGIMEYIVPENTPEDKPKPIEPAKTIDNKTDEQNKVIIGESKSNNNSKGGTKPQTITEQIGGYIAEKLDGLTGQVDNVMKIILIIVTFLALAELSRALRWITIILANLRNTKIYVKVIEGNKERFKLIKKLKVKDENEIKLDLNKLAEEYKTDDLKVIFNKHISKRINKAKIVVNVKEQSLNYNAIYDDKPIELDIKV